MKISIVETIIYRKDEINSRLYPLQQFIIVKNPIGEFVKFYALLPAFYEPFRRLNDFSRIQNPRSNRDLVA